MPRVFRRFYSIPIPADAKPCTEASKSGVAKPAVRFKGTDGKSVVAPLTRNGKRCRLASPYWYGQVEGQRVRLATNRVASEIMLAELVKKSEMGRAGAGDPFEQHRKRPLREHLE